VAWHFQTVHHDIWDYDLPAQPLLLNLEKDGKEIPSVVVVTKMGHIFAFDRRTGEAIFPIEERSVPQSDVPGEQTSPTQPFPIALPRFGLQQLSIGDAWGPSPEYEKQARARISKLVNQGIFTPPSLQGSIITPSNVGGMNWSGASYDPERKLLVANTNRLAAVISLHPRKDASPQSINEKKPRAEIGRQEGTPYLMSRDYLFSAGPDGFIMQTPPPWGTLAAVDMQTGKLKWEVPLGIMMDPDKFPGAEKWGSLNLGGAITTAGGLIFVAGTMDGHLRAFNTETGDQLWAQALPAGGQATPMTYQVNGKQYVVIAAGGHGKLGTQLGDYVVAYALE
jgi:quinoprotein glucose dehydrogenase